MQGQWLCIHSITWALQECPRVMCSAHSSPALQFCEQGLPSSHSPWGRRGVCREKGLGTSFPSGVPGPGSLNLGLVLEEWKPIVCTWGRHASWWWCMPLGNWEV